MNEWRSLTYRDVVVSRRDRQTADNGQGRLLSVTAGSGVIDQASSGRRDISATDKSKYLAVESGDLVYNTMRMWQGVSGLSPLAGIVSPAYTVLRPNPDEVDGRFLAHLMKLPGSITLYRRHSQGLVSDTWNLKFSSLAKLPLRVPPLDEQRRIAEVLDAIDETIQATERVIAKLGDSLRALIANEMTLSGGIQRRLGELARFTNGATFRADEWSDSGLPIIRIQNLNGSSDFNYFTGVPQESWRVRAGELLFAWSGMRESSFGPAIWNGPQGVLNQHIFKVEANETLVDKVFLNLILVENKAKIAGLAHGFKESFVHVTRKELVGFEVRVPDLTEQARLVSLSGVIRQRIENERRSLSKLSRTRVGLAADLLSGRVRTVAS